jgi:hypothetical protein
MVMACCMIISSLRRFFPEVSHLVPELRYEYVAVGVYPFVLPGIYPSSIDG